MFLAPFLSLVFSIYFSPRFWYFSFWYGTWDAQGLFARLPALFNDRLEAISAASTASTFITKWKRNETWHYFYGRRLFIIIIISFAIYCSTATPGHHHSRRRLYLSPFSWPLALIAFSAFRRDCRVDCLPFWWPVFTRFSEALLFIFIFEIFIFSVSAPAAIMIAFLHFVDYNTLFSSPPFFYQIFPRMV